MQDSSVLGLSCGREPLHKVALAPIHIAISLSGSVVTPQIDPQSIALALPELTLPHGQTLQLLPIL